MAEGKKDRAIIGFLRDAAFAIIGGLVIEPTLSQLRIDVSHYLPQVWLAIFGFVIVDGLLRSKKFRRWAVKRDQSLKIGGRIMAYLLVAIIGAIVFSASWFSVTKLLSKPADGSEGHAPTTRPKLEESETKRSHIHVQKFAFEFPDQANGVIKATVFYENDGTLEAELSPIAARISLHEIPSDQPTRWNYESSLFSNAPPSEVIIKSPIIGTVPATSSRSSEFTSPPVSADGIQAFMAKTIAIYFAGVIHYKDDFNRHETDFCVYQMSDGKMFYCHEGNHEK